MPLPGLLEVTEEIFMPAATKHFLQTVVLPIFGVLSRCRGLQGANAGRGDRFAGDMNRREEESTALAREWSTEQNSQKFHF